MLAALCCHDLRDTALANQFICDKLHKVDGTFDHIVGLMGRRHSLGGVGLYLLDRSSGPDSFAKSRMSPVVLRDDRFRIASAILRCLDWQDGSRWCFH